MDWLHDSNGNRCSVEYFGSRERAQKALDSLKNCKNCINCSRCSDCSDCSRCSDCSDCSGCSGCSGCSRCSDCSGCSGCSDCSGCSGLKPAKFSPPEIPKIESIHTKVLEAVSRPGALDMGNWHSCSTTHCRAGWVVTLAGEAGAALEKFHDTPLAAYLIYKASSPHKVSPVRFYESNEVAMDDIRRMAQLENS